GNIHAALHAFVRVGFSAFGHFVGWQKTFDIAQQTIDFNVGCGPTTQGAPTPVLGTVNNGLLTLYMGPNAHLRALSNGQPLAGDNPDPTKRDTDESFTVSQHHGGSNDPNNDSVDVTYMGFSQHFDGVK